MADQETKFTEDELKSLSDLQSEYQQKQMQFGQIKVQKLLVQQQLDAIETQEAQIEVDYAGVQENERKLVKSLNEKYGPGNLDPATGVFTPAPKASEESKEASETA